MALLWTNELTRSPIGLGSRNPAASGYGKVPLPSSILSSKLPLVHPRLSALGGWIQELLLSLGRAESGLPLKTGEQRGMSGSAELSTPVCGFCPGPGLALARAAAEAETQMAGPTPQEL